MAGSPFPVRGHLRCCRKRLDTYCARLGAVKVSRMNPSMSEAGEAGDVGFSCDSFLTSVLLTRKKT